MTDPTKVLLIENHALTRLGVRAVIDGQDDIELLSLGWIVNGVAQGDMWLDSMKVKVHESHSTRTCNQFLSEVRRLL